MASYRVEFIGKGIYKQSYPQIDRIEVFREGPEALAQRRVNTFRPKYPGEWKQDPKSSLPQNCLIPISKIGKYEFVLYERVVGSLKTPKIETVIVTIAKKTVSVDNSNVFSCIGKSDEGITIEFKNPIPSSIMYSMYVPMTQEEYEMRIYRTDDKGLEAVVDDHSSIVCESMDASVVIAKNAAGKYVYRPVQDGTATIRFWNSVDSASYREVVAYKTFFRDNWESFFSSYDISKLDNKSPFRVLMNLLMEFIDALWAYDEDLSVMTDPLKIKYKFLENLGQSVGFTETLTVNKGKENETFYVRLYRELVSQMFGIQQLRGSEAIYTAFFNAIGYDIELLEFWFDDNGNLVEINPHDDTKSSYAIYSKEGRLLQASSNEDPRERVMNRTSTDKASIKNKSWYVLPRLTSKNGSAYSAEYEPVVKQYLEFLRPIHVEYLQTVSTLVMSSFEGTPEYIPTLTDIISVAQFVGAIKGSGFNNYSTTEKIEFKRRPQVFQPRVQTSDKRNVSIFMPMFRIGVKAHEVYRKGMSLIFDHSVSPYRTWECMHANYETRSQDFRFKGYNNWEHSGGIIYLEPISHPRAGSSYKSSENTWLPKGGGLCNDILYSINDYFLVVNYIGLSDTLFGKHRYDAGIKYDDKENKKTYDTYAELSEKFEVVRI